MSCTSPTIEITSAAADLLRKYLDQIGEPSVVVVTLASSEVDRRVPGQVVTLGSDWIVGFSPEYRVTDSDIAAVDGFKVVIDPIGYASQLMRIVVRDEVLAVEREGDD